MAKFTVEEKIVAVQEYLNGQDSISGVAREFGIDRKLFHQWIELYRNHGQEGLRKRYTNYSAEFKLDVLNFMNDTGASPYEAAAIYNIPSRITVYTWKKAVDEGGKDALIPKKKGRPPMKKKPEKPTTTTKPKESLQEEVERLRMENAYLKKLNALVKEKEQSQRNSKPK